MTTPFPHLSTLTPTHNAPPPYKKVWVPASDVVGDGSLPDHMSDVDFDSLAAVAASKTGSSTSGQAAAAAQYEPPSWWVTGSGFVRGDGGWGRRGRPLSGGGLHCVAAAAVDRFSADYKNTRHTTRSPPVQHQRQPNHPPTHQPTILPHNRVNPHRRWDRPGVLPVTGEEQRAARRSEAERVLRRLEAAKNRGDDYEVTTILALRSACMAAGGASLETRTVGARDAIYRAAVDAGIKSCLEPGSVDLGDYSPLRLAAGVASDVSLDERRAVSTLQGAVAGACRARIVEVSFLGG